MTGRVYAVVARAVLSEQAPSLLQRNGGQFSVGRRTGRVVSLWVAIIKKAIIKNAKGTVFKFDRF